MIPEDNLSQIINPVEAKKIVDTLDSIKNKTNESGLSMDNYLTLLKKNGQDYVADYVKENKNQVYITEDVIDASKKARKAQENHNAAIKADTLSAKAANIVLGALSTIGNMAISFVISKVIELVASMASAKQNMLDSAKEIGTSLKDNQTDIKSYKDRINDLHGIINNSSSSIEQVTQARKDLLSIQNEMIAKYGTEKETVESVNNLMNFLKKKNISILTIPAPCLIINSLLWYLQWSDRYNG